MEVEAYNFYDQGRLQMYRESSPMEILEQLHPLTHYRLRLDMEACEHHYVQDHLLCRAPKILGIFRLLKKVIKIHEKHFILRYCKYIWDDVDDDLGP